MMRLQLNTRMYKETNVRGRYKINVNSNNSEYFVITLRDFLSCHLQQDLLHNTGVVAFTGDTHVESCHILTALKICVCMYMYHCVRVCVLAFTNKTIA